MARAPHTLLFCSLHVNFGVSAQSHRLRRDGKGVIFRSWHRAQYRSTNCLPRSGSS